MATAPGIQTEFWEFPGQDFGADLNMWTSNLTTGDDVPLVHSVSYGWQVGLVMFFRENFVLRVSIPICTVIGQPVSNWREDV